MTTDNCITLETRPRGRTALLCSLAALCLNCGAAVGGNGGDDSDAWLGGAGSAPPPTGGSNESGGQATGDDTGGAAGGAHTGGADPGHHESGGRAGSGAIGAGAGSSAAAGGGSNAELGCSSEEYNVATPGEFDCRALTHCLPGSYEILAPTPTSDRACEPCPDGFADAPDLRACKPWAVCGVSDTQLAGPTPAQDAVCVPNPELKVATFAAPIDSYVSENSSIIAVRRDSSDQLGVDTYPIPQDSTVETNWLPLPYVVTGQVMLRRSPDASRLTVVGNWRAPGADDGFAVALRGETDANWPAPARGDGGFALLVNAALLPSGTVVGAALGEDQAEWLFDWSPEGGTAKSTDIRSHSPGIHYSTQLGGDESGTTHLLAWSPYRVLRRASNGSWLPEIDLEHDLSVSLETKLAVNPSGAGYVMGLKGGDWVVIHYASDGTKFTFPLAAGTHWEQAVPFGDNLIVAGHELNDGWTDVLVQEVTAEGTLVRRRSFSEVNGRYMGGLSVAPNGRIDVLIHDYASPGQDGVDHVVSISDD